MRIKQLKYLLVLTLPITCAIAFTQRGWLTWLPVLYAFGFIPFIEYLLGANAKNMDAAAEEVAREDKIYDWLLYLILPVQFGVLIWFFFVVKSGENLSLVESIGRIFSMGVMCGVLGINVAHELGHRAKKSEQNMAKALLLSSLYMHFFIEHNKGHHKNASTVEDPASARFNEMLFVFFVRSIVNSYRGAWRISKKELKRKKVSFWSLQNEMLVFQLIQVVFTAGVFLVFGALVGFSFIAAAFVGIILLETVNYIEHYGLQRQKVTEKRYENVSPMHSWNSDHVVGRLLLFELSRHSDHHANSYKKFQTLKHYDEAPQMPTGYPGMMLLSWFPPLWFAIMNPRIRKIRERQGA